MWVEGMSTWIQPIISFLKDQVLSDNKKEAYKLRKMLARFVFLDSILYKSGFSSPLL